MTDVTEFSKTVLDFLKNTEEYKAYRSGLEEMRRNPVLFARVNELREKNYLLQEESPEDILDKVDALTNEYEDVIGNASVKAFFEAEAAFCKIMQQFNNTVTNGLEFD